MDKSFIYHELYQGTEVSSLGLRRSLSRASRGAQTEHRPPSVLKVSTYTVIYRKI